MKNAYVMIFFFTFNLLNCAEYPRLPKDAAVKKFWEESNIMNKIAHLGKDYKAIQIVIQREILHYCKNPLSLENLQAVGTPVPDSSIQKMLTLQTLASKSMTHVYKLNGD